MKLKERESYGHNDKSNQKGKCSPKGDPSWLVWQLWDKVLKCLLLCHHQTGWREQLSSWRYWFLKLFVSPTLTHIMSKKIFCIVRSEDYTVLSITIMNSSARKHCFQGGVVRWKIFSTKYIFCAYHIVKEYRTIVTKVVRSMQVTALTSHAA